jgi:hypothetical protein
MRSLNDEAVGGRLVSGCRSEEERGRAHEGVPRSKKREVCEGMAWYERNREASVQHD